MKLIKSQADLQKYIPNVLATVKGETSLFDKLAESLVLAEDWLIRTFTGSETFNRIATYSDDNPIRKAAATCIVSEAFRLSVPNLDLVLTPNGFGIVSNANIAPASKERITRLLESLIEQRDKAIHALIMQLPEAHAWAGSERYSYFYGTLFPTLNLPKLCGITTHLWDEYVKLREKILDIETRIAYEFLSPELLKELHSGLHPELANKVRSLILSIYFGAPLEFKIYADVLNDIRKNYYEYKAWHDSETAQRFSSTTFFINKKESRGYWF